MSEVKTFFDIANNVNSSYNLLEKEKVMGATNVFMLNRALSNNHDTVFFADEASSFKYVDPYSHYLFHFYSTPKKKRYGKWEKKAETSDHLEAVMKVYDVSRKRALEYLEILTEDQLEELKASLETGGKLGRQKKSVVRKKEED